MASKDDEILELENRVEELEEELKWKSKLLQQRTEALYHLIQTSQDALNKIPVGMVT